MKALVYPQFGPAEVLEWVDDWPYPALTEHSVLVKTVAGSINPKDILLRKGKFSGTFARDPLPRATGLDVAGHVVAVGKKVVDFAVGDSVYGMTNHFAGGVHVAVAHFQQNEIQHAPNNLSLEIAAAIPLAAQTALQALRDCCAIKPGQKVLINGASGGVGHFAVQIANIMGAETHAVCGPNNVDFVKSLGAKVVYNYASQSITEINTKFNAIFDAFGNYDKAKLAQQLAKRGVYVSTVPKRATLQGELLARLGVQKSSRLVVVRSNSVNLLQLKHWIEQGLLKPHVEKFYPVANAIDAHKHVESRHTVGKVCIAFNE